MDSENALNTVSVPHPFPRLLRKWVGSNVNVFLPDQEDEIFIVPPYALSIAFPLVVHALPAQKTPFLRFFLRVQAHKSHAQNAPTVPRVLADYFLTSSHNNP
jgi:hypothetical protein